MAAHPIDAALFAKLRNDATLMGIATGGLWRGTAPQGETYGKPFLLVQMQSATYTHSFGPRTPVEEVRYSIDAVSEVTDDPAERMADRVFAILNHGTLTIAGYTLAHMEAEERMAYPEEEGDEKWHHRAGVYRIEAIKN